MSGASPSPGFDSSAPVSVAVAAPSIPEYELVRIVGRGSYGDVWLGRGITGVWRAIKVVWRHRFTDAEPFEREFRGLKEFAEISLGESSQMTVLHVGRNDVSGFFYYVMELADDAERGQAVDPASYVPLTLAELRARRGRIPAGECTRHGVELARVLASLHRRRLVHRDVKPSNIIFVSGVPKLADIGLIAPSAMAQTFVGTEGYVPPDGPGTPGADVFALGKVLYELATGHDRQEFPKLPADLARLPDRRELLELNEVLVRACHPTPAGRYVDGAALLADLTALHGGASLRTRRVARFLTRAAAVLALAGALGLGTWRWASRPTEAPPVAAGISPYSVAVLPFTLEEADPAQAYLGFGFGDEMLQVLARENDLRVTGSRSSFWAGGQPLPAVELARALRVASVVEGTLRRDDTRLRATVRLVRGFDGAGRTLGTFERDERDVFALHEEVARAIAREILGRVTLPARAPPTTNPGAYDEFLRGRYVQMGRVTAASEAAQHFERAIALDPGFAVAWARLAEARHRAEGFTEARNADPEDSVPTIDHALALQPDLALAWVISGYARGTGLRDPARGLRDLVRAEELGGPNAETRMMRFLVAYGAGETRGLLPLAREAVAGNPENIERNTIVQMAMSYLGDFAEADRLYRRSLAGEGGELSPTAFSGRAQMHLRWRGAAAALRLLEQAPSGQAALLPLRVQALAALGRTHEAAHLLDGAPPTTPLDVFLDAGETDQARARAAARLAELRSVVAASEERTNRENFRGHAETARSDLIIAEHLLGQGESALQRLEVARQQTVHRHANRRTFTAVGRRLPRLYVLLGQPEAAIELLRQNIFDGYCPGYELRDTPAYAPLADHPVFQELRREAEAWAAQQPDPIEDPVAKNPRQP